MSILNTLWGDVIEEQHRLQEEFENLRELLDLRLENLLVKPQLLRPLFAYMRQHHPIFIAPHLAVVSKYTDVLEILEHEDVFSVVEIYANKMEQTTGDFVLGMGNTPQYWLENELMSKAVHPEDIARINTFVANYSADLVSKALPKGRIDAVQELSLVVPTRLLETYFGTPGPDERVIMHWMRSIFREIFLNLANDPNMAQEAASSSVALNSWLDGLIITRKTKILAGDVTPDDFLDRLIKIQQSDPTPFDDSVIRRILGGTIVGTVDTNSKAIAQALDQLLDRPEKLLAARAAALDDDDDRLAHYVFEALRFNPQNPFLLRHCKQSYTAAAGTTHAAVIPQNSLALVGTESAMFDPDVFPYPDDFRTDRPLSKYIHFGHGQHTCFGRHIAGVLIPGVIKQLLLHCPNLRRAEGVHGELIYDGGFPNNLNVVFDTI